jgi:hypothetical protein
MASPNLVVIVPCGGRKADAPAPAGELYTGTYHRAARRAADTLTANGGRVLILSSLHGLVTLDQILAPYELRAGQPGTVTGETLRAQAAALGITDAATVVLGGRAYVELARQVWPALAAPLDKTRGIGEQMSRLAAIYKTALTPVPAVAIDGDALHREYREHAEAVRAARLEREARRRAVYVTAAPLRITGGVASTRFTFPTGTGTAKTQARVRAARRFAAANGIRLTQLGAATLQAHGSPERIARFTSALPRLVELVEKYTSLAVRHYGRWMEHSTTARHRDGKDAAELRALARTFRARAFDAIVATLLRPDLEPAPRIDEDAPLWEQADAVAAQYAEYGWVDVTAQADADEVARLLAAAVVESAAPALAPIPGLRVLAVRPARRPARRTRTAPQFDQLDLFAAAA